MSEGYWFNENDSTCECDTDTHLSSKCFGLYEKLEVFN